MLNELQLLRWQRVGTADSCRLIAGSCLRQQAVAASGSDRQWQAAKEDINTISVFRNRSPPAAAASWSQLQAAAAGLSCSRIEASKREHHRHSRRLASSSPDSWGLLLAE